MALIVSNALEPGTFVPKVLVSRGNCGICFLHTFSKFMSYVHTYGCLHMHIFITSSIIPFGKKQVKDLNPEFSDSL